MNRYILIMIAAIISLALYFLHMRIYRKSRRKFRANWAACTVGFGSGGIFYHLPEWIYGVSVDFTALWTGIVICGIGVVMFILSREGKFPNLNNN